MARRVAVAGLTALLVALNSFALNASPAAASPAAAASTADFVPGTGSAAATVERIALRSSGATLGIGVGTAKARYQGAQGNAEAAGIDLGMLEVASKSPLACGRGMGDLLPPEAMPERVRVSSGDGPSAQRSASFGAGTPLEIGSQAGSARPNSAADAAVGGVNLDLPGLLSAVGGTARSAATLTPGRQRLAQSESGMGSLSLAGGLVQLEGMRWTAAHRTGTAADAAARFVVGGISVGGQALPTSDAASVADGFDRANAALAPLGLSLNPPAVVRGDRGVAVTPLRLTVSPTPALKSALVVALTGAQPARTELLKLLKPATLGEDCGLADAVGFGYLIADLALVVLGDGGGIDVDFGGATAGTYFTTYANPLQSGFGALTPLPGTAAGLPGTAAGLPGTAAGLPGTAAGLPGTATGLPGTAAGLPGTATGLPGTAAGVSQQPVAAPASLSDAAPTSWICRSTHASGDGCAGRAGRLAGWLALALIVVLAVADRLRSRVR